MTQPELGNINPALKWARHIEVLCRETMRMKRGEKITHAQIIGHLENVREKDLPQVKYYGRNKDGSVDGDNDSYNQIVGGWKEVILEELGISVKSIPGYGYGFLTKDEQINDDTYAKQALKRQRKQVKSFVAMASKGDLVGQQQRHLESRTLLAQNVLFNLEKSRKSDKLLIVQNKMQQKAIEHKDDNTESTTPNENG